MGEEKEEIDDNRVNTSTFDLALQVLAIVTFFTLLIVDKGYDLMAKPINDIWYGIIGGFGIGGIDLIKAILRRR